MFIITRSGETEKNSNYQSSLFTVGWWDRKGEQAQAEIRNSDWQRRHFLLLKLIHQNYPINGARILVLVFLVLAS